MDKFTVAQRTAQEVLDSPEFKRLVRKRWLVSGVLLALLFTTYYGYILIVGLDKAFLAQKIGVVTTLGIPLGVGVIVFSFILTAIYVHWANTKYDPEVQRLRDLIKGGEE
jgi:uncharacterized membrane protein (DUF485 family)